PDISDSDRRMFLLAVCAGTVTADDFHDDFWHRDPWRVMAKSIGEMYAAEYHDSPVMSVPIKDPITGIPTPEMLKTLIGWSGRRNITNSNKEIAEKDILALPEALKTGEMPGAFTSVDYYLGDETVQNIYEKIVELHYHQMSLPSFLTNMFIVFPVN